MTFKNIAGFDVLGIGGPAPGPGFANGAGGVINMANLPASINEIIYQTGAQPGGLTITNQINPLKVNTEDNGNGAFMISAGAGFTDSFTLDIGNALHNSSAFGPGVGSGTVGVLRLTADFIVNINATGQTAAGPVIVDTLGFVSLTPAVSGNEVVTIGGNTTLHVGYGGGGCHRGLQSHDWLSEPIQPDAQ